MLSWMIKHRWILTELKYLNMLGFTGALGFFCDAIQAKTGTIFISRTSGADIGNKVSALFIGQAIMASTSYVVVQGIAAGMSTLCSQAYGATNYKLMGTYFMRALIIASLTCFPIWTIWISVKPVIYYITQSSELAQGAGDYASILCFSYPAYIYSRLVFIFLQSQNTVLPNLVVLIIGNLLNICLQYMFVVFIPLEIKGVAVSYVISNYLIAVLIFAYLRFSGVHSTYSIFSWSNLSGWYHFLKYGAPAILQILVGIIACRIIPIIFFGFILRDTNQLALVGIFNALWFVFVAVSLGFGIGANVRIGNLLGENNWVQARRATILFICFVSAIELCFGIFVSFFSYYLSYLFTAVPEIRQEVEFGFKILGFGIFTDILFTTKGLCNACCFQIRTFIFYLLFTLVAAPLGCVFAFYVSWKAAAYYLAIEIGFFSTTCYNVLLLLCSNWEKISKKVSQNTRPKLVGLNEQSSDKSSFQPLFSRCEKVILFSRYVSILVIGLIISLLASTISSKARYSGSSRSLQ